MFQHLFIVQQISTKTFLTLYIPLNMLIFIMLSNKSSISLVSASGKCPLQKCQLLHFMLYKTGKYQKDMVMQIGQTTWYLIPCHLLFLPSSSSFFASSCHFEPVEMKNVLILC